MMIAKTSNGSAGDNEPVSGGSPFKMVVPLQFLLTAVLGCSLVAFYTGQFAAVSLVQKFGGTHIVSNNVLHEEPNYTVKHFDMSHRVTSYSMAVEEDDEEDDEEDEEEDEGMQEEEKGELPNCHHLMVDIEYVGAQFLSSEDRLTESMLQLVDRCDLSMIYSNCHERDPAGLICVAALEKSRLAVTTWPERSQIAVDLQVCTEERDRDWAMSTVPVLQELFGTKDKESHREPHSIWLYKRRGFRDESKQFNPDDVDFEDLVGERISFKNQLASVQSPFQRIDVFEGVHEKYTYGSNRLSRNVEGEHGPRNPDGFQIDRVVLLDHVEQSMLFGEAAYHEALVHPVMFSHANPRRVAIIGGGEGATLREVLKHRTVERAVMVEIDEVMVNVSRTYLPEWSDCSNIVGSAPSCFEDPRAEVYFEDAIAWFIKRYLNDSDHKEEDLFDVIIMDALDPTSVVEFSDMLYDNEDLARAISNALGDEGVFVLQVGEGDDEDDPPEVYGKERRLTAFRQHLEENGFRTITEYDETHCGFNDPWGYQLAFKSGSNVARFFSNEAEVTLAIQIRMLPTLDGDSPFRFFDGATMMTYQLVPRVVANLWCLGKDTPCESGDHGLDADVPSLPASAFEVKERDTHGDVGVYAKVDIPQGWYIAPEETVQGIFAPPLTYQLLKHFSETFHHPYWDCLFSSFLQNFGWTDDFYGQTAAGTSGGIFALLNHGCDKSYNTGILLPATEKTVKTGEGPGNVFDYTVAAYNPFAMRHHARFMTWFNASRDIQAGEEIRDNHLAFGGRNLNDTQHWEENLAKLRTLCRGNARHETEWSVW